MSIDLSSGNISSGITLVTHEGDTAFLPCSFPLANTFSIVWEINGVTYNVDSLPRNLQRTSNGLLIKQVSSSDAGYYTCYSHANTAKLQQLYVVHLVVNVSPGMTL